MVSNSDVEMRWVDPVPESGTYTLDTPSDKRITLDFERLINIVVKAGYNGYIGIEYEGDKHTEIEGIKRTKQALDEIRSML